LTMAFQFDNNERVLCYHGPMIYEAKVLKRQEFPDPNPTTGDVGPHYFVHYKGWKQSWDEWVPLNRVLKYNEENLNTQKSLQAAKAKPNTSKSAKNEGTSGNRKKDGTTRGTKRSREEDDGSKKPDLKLNVPDVLKLILVDDWEAVTKNNQLTTLPRTPTVQELLQEYKDHILSLNRPPPHPAVLPNIIQGLQTYFDRSLGANLLYRFERPQYAAIRKKYITGPDVKPGVEVDMSTIYGAEHFLRMLVSLPNMVASSTMDPESVLILKSYVQEFFDFMVKEKDRIFQFKYDETDMQYQNISRS